MGSVSEVGGGVVGGREALQIKEDFMLVNNNLPMLPCPYLPSLQFYLRDRTRSSAAVAAPSTWALQKDAQMFLTRASKPL